MLALAGQGLRGAAESKAFTFDLSLGGALAIDLAALHGKGTDKQPGGVYNPLPVDPQADPAPCRVFVAGEVPAAPVGAARLHRRFGKDLEAVNGPLVNGVFDDIRHRPASWHLLDDTVS